MFKIFKEDYNDALKSVEDSISLDPTRVEYYFKKAQILDELKQFTKAIECFERAISLGTTNQNYDLDEFHSDLGYVYFNNKRYRKALECWNIADPYPLRHSLYKFLKVLDFGLLSGFKAYILRTDYR